jgi:hypothetical protein
MVRLIEGYQVDFANGRVDAQGRHLKYGDIVRNAAGNKSARIIGTPVVTGTNWGAAGSTAASGRMVLTNTEGQFISGENLYLSDGDGSPYAQTTGTTNSQKRNYIMVYFSDDKTPATGNLIHADLTRIGVQREYAEWPKDDWTERTTADDYFSLIGNNSSSATPIPWTSLDTDSDNYYDGKSPNFFESRNDTDFRESVIRTWALVSPSWTVGDGPEDFAPPGDHIALITSSSAGTSTYYDDFAIQLDMKAGTGFLPPIQQ